jgi:hypothetical protein
VALPAYKNPKVQESVEKKSLSEEALQRLADCQNEKRSVQQDIEECYYFASPRRRRTASSANNSSSTSDRPSDKFELQTSVGFEIADDFVTMAIKSFTPAEAQWAERKPEPDENGEINPELETHAKEQDKKIFGMVRASNFHAELGKSAVPDLAIGAVGMLIIDRHAALPVVCQGVPLREIEIGLGPDGRIDDRWIVRNTKYRHVRAYLPGVTLPDLIEKKIKESPNEKCQVKRGWWRNWDNVGDVEWQYVAFVDADLVDDGKLTGEGSCPFIIGRFGANPDYAWPDGPMIKSLPELRTLDEISAGIIEHIDFALRPPVSYEDDGVINMSSGVESGMAYPKRPNGGREIFEEIYKPRAIDSVLFDEMNRVKRVRRLHYVDFPEQRGKTPPSATQWLDEMVIQQDRIGTPGYSYWHEFPYEVFQRFRYIGEVRGKVQAVQLEGGMPLQPYNPAQRAHENQEVLQGLRLLQAVASTFPQTMPVIIDDQKTVENLKKRMGDEIVVLRAAAELKQAFENVGQLAGVIGPRTTGGLPAATGGNGAV